MHLWLKAVWWVAQLKEGLMENQMKNQNLYSILILQVIVTGVTICLHGWKFSRLFLNTGFRGAAWSDVA